MHTMKRFVKPVNIVNLILIFISLSGFIYQVYLIFEQYMLGKTVLNIEVKRLKAQTLPAITVCIPPFSISKLSVLSETSKALYQEYKKIINKGLADVNFTQEQKKNLKSIHDDIFYNHDNIGKIVDFKQLFELSPKSEGSVEKIVTVTIEGETKSFLNESYILNAQPPYYHVTETPIISFVSHESYYMSKCFTFFSALKEYWNSFLYVLKKLQIQVNNDYNHFAPGSKYLVSIHSSNILQQYFELDYFEVKSEKDYHAKYSQLNIELISDSFEANCADYNIRNEHGEIRMESDCRVYCTAQLLKEKFNSKIGTMVWVDLIRTEVWESFGNISIDLKEYNHTMKEVLTKCKMQTRLQYQTILH